MLRYKVIVVLRRGIIEKIGGRVGRGGNRDRIEATTKQNYFSNMVVSIHRSAATRPPRRNENKCAEFSGTLQVKM